MIERSNENVAVVEVLEDRTMLTVFTVANTADSGAGSLRWAITQSNNTAGVDTIAFNIASPSKVITPMSALPIVYDAAIIDGTTQPGYAGKPVVQIDGASAGAGMDGLKLFGSSVLKGLSITRFTGQGVTTIPRTDVSYGGNIIQNNWIGLDTAGHAAGNGLHGVGLYSSSNLVDHNVISGNAAGDGVFALGTLFGGGHGYNTIQNNIIGLDSTGTVAMGNLNGIGLQDSPANHVLNNVLSANHDDGLLLMNPSTSDAHGTVVTGNIVGLDITGANALGNGLYGMEIQSANNTIGGTVAGARNVISGNALAGIVFWKSGALGSIVQGNYIGTDATGTKGRGNGAQGIAFSNAGANLIGGTVAGAGNVISANGQEGVGIFPGSGEILQGNIIGADAFGNALGNATWGVTVINGSDHVVIGGTAAGAGNYIAFNGKTAIWVSDPASATVAGNSYTATTPAPTPTPTPAPTPTPTPALGKIGFSTSQTVVNVLAGYAMVTLVRTGDTSAAATVYCATAAGTGAAGVAFKAASATLTFAQGQASMTLAVKLLATTAAGRSATFSLKLSSPRNATLSGITTTVVTVVEYTKASHRAPVRVVKRRHHSRIAASTR